MHPKVQFEDVILSPHIHLAETDWLTTEMCTGRGSTIFTTSMGFLLVVLRVEYPTTTFQGAVIKREPTWKDSTY
jgi:hypothetical protein